jgi:pimeloyl-ACP methyl ester carboxylesterase
VNVIVQGTSIHLEDEGSGPPALFLHGNPDSSILWRQVIKELKPRFRCLAPDLPGFGHSSIPQNFNYSLTEMAAFVDDIEDSAEQHHYRDRYADVLGIAEMGNSVHGLLRSHYSCNASEKQEEYNQTADDAPGPETRC